MRPTLAFQSTLPGWGATWIRDTSTTILLISIHAPRMGSDLTVRRLTPRECISIHAPRMGSDQFHELSRLVVSISIHAPRMGSDGGGIFCVLAIPYFNPRSPDGERQIWVSTPPHSVLISIHAPRMGSDTVTDNCSGLVGRISIHAPRMGSDFAVDLSCYLAFAISIHAPQMGSDGERCGHGHVSVHNFNPRSPDGERLAFGRDGDHEICDFNPRSPDGERPIGRCPTCSE